MVMSFPGELKIPESLMKLSTIASKEAPTGQRVDVPDSPERPGDGLACVEDRARAAFTVREGKGITRPRRKGHAEDVSS